MDFSLGDLAGKYILTTMTFVPLLGALLIVLVPRGQNSAMKWIAAIMSAIPLLLCWPLLNGFKAGHTLTNPEVGAQFAQYGFQFVTNVPWIEAFNVRYAVGVDGISITMVVLTSLLSFLCIIASWGFEHWHTSKGLKGYLALFLLLETGMMGVFVSMDFFLFYVFWEMMLLPMYFLIGIWGGPRREYAAIKFFLYTLAGSVFMLIVMLAMYFTSTDVDTATPGVQHTFMLPELMAQAGLFTGTPWLIAFIGLYVGFAIKIPAFPFHTWLPDAHVEAPTPISVILAGVLLKMGTYGIMRICYPILPEAAYRFSPVMMLFGTIGIVYGAMCAMAQIRGVPRVNAQTGEQFIERDFKKMIAYSSVSHMGFCMIGLASGTPAGMQGCLLQMWNHGTITSMLFLLVGVVYDRAHHRNIDGFGGLWDKMPVYGGLTALAFMASLGLPGLAGFIGEALCFLGGFQAGPNAGIDPATGLEAKALGLVAMSVYYKLLTGISVVGVVFGAGYFLWSYQKIFLGKLNPKYADIEDVNPREQFTLWPLLLLIVWFGVYPKPILDLIVPGVNYLATQINFPWFVK
jgi:NADH-quinone oxidoreductase subunit M